MPARPPISPPRRMPGLLLVTAVLFACTVAAVPAAGKDLLAAVQARGILKVALDGNDTPFSFRERRTGAPAGYDVEVARLLASRLGLRAEFVHAERTALLAGLADSKYDVAVAQLAINPMRELAFDFSIPYAYVTSQLIPRQDARAAHAPAPSRREEKYAGAIERIGIPFQRGNPQFKAALDKALAETAADGSLQAIALKWFDTDISRAP